MSEEKPQEPPVLDAEIVEATEPQPADAPPPVVPEGDYTTAGVPTFDYVRDRVEGRTATAIGSTELASESPEGRSVDEQFTAREKAGRDKLEEIRRAMRGE